MKHYYLVNFDGDCKNCNFYTDKVYLDDCLLFQSPNLTNCTKVCKSKKELIDTVSEYLHLNKNLSSNEKAEYIFRIFNNGKD